MKDLFWVGQKIVIDKKSRKGYGSYMKNPHLMLLKKNHIQFLERQRIVVVTKMKREDCGTESSPGKTYRMELMDFVKRYLIAPLRGFYGNKFYGSGAYSGNSSFRHLLAFAATHPKVINKLSRPRRSCFHDRSNGRMV